MIIHEELAEQGVQELYDVLIEKHRSFPSWANVRRGTQIVQRSDASVLHYYCEIVGESRSVDYGFTLFSRNRTNSIHTCFREDSIKGAIISGSSADLAQLSDAGLAWLSGKPAEDLVEEYEFLGGELWALRSIRDEIARRCQGTPLKFSFKYESPQYKFLDISFRNRCAEITSRQKDKYDFKLFHNNCLIFTNVKKENYDLDVIIDWLVSCFGISEMEGKYPNLKSYSKTRDLDSLKIEDDFLSKWEWVISDYRSLAEKYPEFSSRVLIFIDNLKKIESINILRVGKAMHTLIFSRSRMYGLRAGQKRVLFDFSEIKNGKIKMHSNIDRDFDQPLEISHVDHEVKAALNLLSQVEID